MKQEKILLINILDNVLLIIKQQSLLTYRNPQFNPIFQSQTFVSRKLIEKKLIKQYSLIQQTITTLCLSACKKFLLLITKNNKQSAGNNLYIINFTQLPKDLTKYESFNKLLERYLIPVNTSTITFLKDIVKNNFSLSTQNNSREHYILSSAHNKIIKVLKISKSYPIICIESKLQIQGAMDNFLPIFVTQCAQKFILVRNNSEINRIYLCKLIGEKNNPSKINFMHSELSISYTSIKNKLREFQIIALADSIENKALACLVKSEMNTQSGPIHKIALIIIDRFSSTQKLPYEVGMQVHPIKQVLKTRIIPFDQDSRLNVYQIQHIQKSNIQWQQDTVVINIDNKFFLWQDKQSRDEYLNYELSQQQTYITNTYEKSEENYRFIICKDSALYNLYLNKKLKKKLQSSGSSSKSNQQKNKIQNQVETPKKKKMEMPVIKQTIQIDIDLPDTLVKTMTFGNDLQSKASQQKYRKSFNNNLSEIKQFPEMQESKHSSITSDIFSSQSKPIRIDSNPFKKQKEPSMRVQEQDGESDSSPYKIIEKQYGLDDNFFKIELQAKNFIKFCTEKDNKVQLIEKKTNATEIQIQNLMHIIENIKDSKEIANNLKLNVNSTRSKLTDWLNQAQVYNMGAKKIKQTMQQFIRKNRSKQTFEKFWKNYNIELKRHIMDSRFRYQSIQEDYENIKISKSLFKCSIPAQQKIIKTNLQQVATIPKKRIYFDARSQQQNSAQTLKTNKQTRPSITKINRKLLQQDYIPIPRTCITNLNQLKPLITLPKIQ